MARGESKDLLTRLADAGEEALHRLSDAPGADRLSGAVGSMRDRIDELQKRVRGLEGIDRRVADLERRFGSPAASLGRHLVDAKLEASTCPLVNRRGCYAVEFEVTRIRDEARRIR